MDPELGRKATAELVGTALLVAIVVGSGIFAQRLSSHDLGLQLLENSTATGAGLVALIMAFGSVSGAHFNPVVTLADRLLGGLSNADAAIYVLAQVVGACIGAVIANLMFDLPAVTWSTHARSSGGLWLGETVATFGLLMVILGVVRSGRGSAAPFAVGGYIAAAYWFTSSTSFANPAVTVGRTLTDTFAGIKPSSAPAFLAAQLLGGLGAVGLARYLYPRLAAEDLIVPHERSEGRFARPGLHASTCVQGQTRDGIPAVLFLCVHNAGRSQMAVGWFNRLAGDQAVAWSGGSEPGTEVNPSAMAAMAEVGIDITKEHPKPWTDEIVRAADVVVTMGCGDACPLFPGKRYEDWEVDDPAGRGLDAVRPIRNEIERRVRELLASLDVVIH